MAWGNPQQLALEESLCQKFNSQNPGLYVRFVRVPASAYANKMVLMLASHTAPDVMRVDHYNFPALVKRDYFLDLSPYAKADKEFHEADFFPAAVSECKWKNRLYALEVLFGGIILSYNKNLVKAAGLEDPYLVWKKGEWTWDRFREYARRMTAKGPNGRYLTFGTTIPSFPTDLLPVRDYGGEILGSDGFVHLDSPAAMIGWNMWHEMETTDKCAPTASQAANSAYPFESGKLGMEFSFIGTAVRYREVIKDFDWDTCPVPKGPEFGGSLLKGNQLAASADTQHPEAAWRFIRFMTSEPTEKLLSEKIRRCLPTRKRLAASPEYLKSARPPYHLDTYLDVAEHGRTLPITDRWAEWTTAFIGPVQAWLDSGEGDGRIAVHRGVVAANRVLSDEEGL
jgi:multiple sugar transport system substrate-binding protein